MKQSFVVNTKLKAIEYIMLVNDIASQYFFSDGTYAPQTGLLNAMQLFYNICVKSSKYDDTIAHNSDSMDSIEILVADDDFVKAFNNALVVEGYRMDFANAFRDAMDIVETRKSSLYHAVDMIENVIMLAIDKITPALTKENIENVKAIAEDISKGNISAQSVVEAYSKSDRIKELIKLVPKEQSKSEENKE
ncbi:MAG: hypothetical protein PUD22_05540 [Erysipelotrichaceae bacterium]|nr:hypothetical protein [Erysipelotrichaceae bacterium]